MTESPSRRIVGASSVALGEWLTGLSPGGAGEEHSNLSLTSPGHHNSVAASHDLCFSPGMFSPSNPKNINIAMSGGQGDHAHAASTVFSPSLFSPATSKLLKKRHLMSPPGSL